VRRLFAILLLLSASLAAADQPLLPERFAGWEKSESDLTSDPAQADAASAAVLAEYGFAGAETATYTREGRKLKLKAARLKDRSSAYGAFVFYKDPAMQPEQAGDQAASRGGHVLFYRGTVLVDAVFERPTAMSVAELRELAGLLPVEREPQGQPPIIDHLPRQSYVKNSVKYVLGPAGLNAIGAPLPAELVDFSKSPEVATGRYQTSAGQATLTLIYYPTPQIAAERLRAIEEAMNPEGTPRSEADNFAAKRSGPIVAVVTGAIPAGEAKSLLASIAYDAEVTWNEPTKLTARDNPINLVWAAIKLSAFLVGVMFVISIGFGLARYGLRRFWPAGHDSGEMISLDLRAEPAGGRPELPPGTPK